MRSKLTTIVIILISITTLLACSSCHEDEKSKKDNIAAAREKYGPDDVVAEIGDYSVTRQQLSDEMLKEYQPREIKYDLHPQMLDPEDVLINMLRDYAAIMYWKGQGYPESDEIVNRIVQARKNKLLATMLVDDIIENNPVAAPTQEQIDEKIKNDPNLTPIQATAMITNQLQREIVMKHYNDLMKNRNVKMHPENYGQAAIIYRRLQNKPLGPGVKPFITKVQVRDLDQKEKDIVLITFDGGKTTLADMLWFMCENYSPGSRPKSLTETSVIEDMLQSALVLPLWSTEAKSREIDKDPVYIEKASEIVRGWILSKDTYTAVKDLENPTYELAEVYFNNNKSLFVIPDTLVIDQIWCDDYKTAKALMEKIKPETDFQDLKKQFGENMKSYETQITALKEGVFFKDIWDQAEIGKVIGPVKGLYRKEVKWRVVKILDKIPSKERQLDKEAKKIVRDKLRVDLRYKAVQDRRAKLLSETPYKIYKNKLVGIDPLYLPKQ